MSNEQQQRACLAISLAQSFSPQSFPGVVAYAHRNCAASKERSVNQTSPSPPAYPDDAPEPDARDTEHAAESAASGEHHPPADAPSAPEHEREPERVEPTAAAPTAEETRARAGEKAVNVSPRPAVTPPPLPTFGTPQAPPRPAPSPLRGQEMPRFELPQPQGEQPAYPPRLPAPQPAPPGGMSEPPRPYEGGRYVPPPPIPPPARRSPPTNGRPRIRRPHRSSPRRDRPRGRAILPPRRCSA